MNSVHVFAQSSGQMYVQLDSDGSNSNSDGSDSDNKMDYSFCSFTISKFEYQMHVSGSY